MTKLDWHLITDILVYKGNPYNHPIRVLAREAVKEDKDKEVKSDLQRLLQDYMVTPEQTKFYLSMFSATVLVSRIKRNSNLEEAFPIRLEHKRPTTEWFEELDLEGDI